MYLIQNDFSATGFGKAYNKNGFDLPPELVNANAVNHRKEGVVAGSQIVGLGSPSSTSSVQSAETVPWDTEDSNPSTTSSASDPPWTGVPRSPWDTEDPERPTTTSSASIAPWTGMPRSPWDTESATTATQTPEPEVPKSPWASDKKKRDLLRKAEAAQRRRRGRRFA